MPRKVEYKEETAKQDAEAILRKVMKRSRFGYDVRDQLAEALQRIVQREAA